MSLAPIWTAGSNHHGNPDHDNFETIRAIGDFVLVLVLIHLLKVEGIYFNIQLDTTLPG